MKIDTLKTRLANKDVIIMDGGTGTEILRRGHQTTLPLWSAEVLLTNPQIIKKIHYDYIKAGAEIIITNTFRTQKRTFAKAGKDQHAKAATILASKIVQDAIKESGVPHVVYIAGSIAPLEDCYTPDIVPSDADLQKEHYEHARNLKEGGVDFLLVETMNTIKEAVFALRAAQRVGLPIAISFCCNDRLELLSGESLEEMVKKITPFDPLFLSINCTSIKATTKIIKKLRKLTPIPLGVYANGDGCPDPIQGWKFIGNITKEQYLKHARLWIKEGVQIIGGCCGTDPSYISLLSQSLPKKIS